MKAEVLNTRISKWGEGPVWWRDRFWYVDIAGKALIRMDPDSGEEKLWEVGQPIGFALPCVSGRWIWGGEQGIFFLDPESGVSTPIADPEPGPPKNRFNDAAISPDGRLFAGTITNRKTPGTASLYRVDPDLGCHTVRSNVTNSNGIDWTPDGRTCYYIDTPTYDIRKFDYRADSGELVDTQNVMNTRERMPGVPDGMCMDAEGMIWVAFCHGGCVARFDPATFEEKARIEFPVSETTSCCFGGPGLRDLYVTTGINAKQPEKDAGKIFVIRNAGRGMPQNAFRDA